MAVTESLLSLSRVSFAYPDGTPALRDVSMEVHEGERVGLVGGNGAGKSTLLLHLVGVLLPQSGTVRVFEHTVSSSTKEQIRRKVGFVFQDPDDQLFMPTVEDDVAFGPVNQGLTCEQVEERTRVALDQMQASHLRKRPPYRLSAGEKRAVAIATILAMSPDILVMDEPTSHLDPLARRSLIAQLSRLEHTQVIASHDLDFVYDVCSRTIVLAEGRVAANGPTHEVLTNDELLERCRLERPLCLIAPLMSDDPA